MCLLPVRREGRVGVSHSVEEGRVGVSPSCEEGGEGGCVSFC